jgi:hypothetical protein
MVVEPIVTEEKLRSLLNEQCELSCLDFKKRLNLGQGPLTTASALSVRRTRQSRAHKVRGNGRRPTSL